MAKCEAETTAKKICNGHAVQGSRFCYFHDPTLRELRRESQKKGGSKRSSVAISPPLEFDLSDKKAATKLLACAASRILSGQLDPRAGNAIAYIVDCALRDHQDGSITERLDRLERLQQAESNSPFDPTEYSMTTFDDEEEPVQPEQERNERASS